MIVDFFHLMFCHLVSHGSGKTMDLQSKRTSVARATKFCARTRFTNERCAEFCFCGGRNSLRTSEAKVDAPAHDWIKEAPLVHPLCDRNAKYLLK